MTLFHFTLHKFLSNILDKGLKTDTGNSGFCKLDSKFDMYKQNFGLQPIFLTSDPERTIKTMLGKTVDRYTLLSVHNIIALPEKYPMIFIKPELAPWDRFSHIYLQNIPTSLIQIET